MAPTQSKMVVARGNAAKQPAPSNYTRIAGDRVAKRTRRALRNSTNVSLHAVAEATVFAMLQDPRKRYGHVVGTAMRMGVSTSVCAIFDIKNYSECTHWDNDDIGDDCLRDFKDLGTLSGGIGMGPTRAAIYRGNENTANANVFIGYLYANNDPTPELIMATLVRNKRGRWIGENVVNLSAAMMFRLSEDLPAGIVRQIEQFREEKTRREEMEQREYELEKWEAELEEREKAVRIKEEAVGGVEER